MSFLLNAMVGRGRKFFLPAPAAGGATSYFVLEVDGTSHIELEGVSDDLILEA
jgi:SOS-response transcriptional repressor LexA